MSLLHHLDSSAKSNAAPTRCELPHGAASLWSHCVCPGVKYKYKLKDQCSECVSWQRTTVFTAKQDEQRLLHKAETFYKSRVI